MDRYLTLVTAVLTLALGGCAGRDPADPAAADPTPPTAVRVVVDSARPIDDALRLFREGLPPVDTLSGGAADRDSLVVALTRALERHDTLALRGLVVTRAEFAFLYYPHTRYLRAPYEIEPALLWFMIQQNSEKGASRALREYGGQRFDQVRLRCERTPATVGRMREWSACVVARRAPGSVSSEHLRLFGSIVEHEGRYKFMSYANDL